MKLFCFTHAGGTADFFDELKQELEKAEIELIAPEYPGHGRRRREKHAANFEELAEDMLEQISSHFDPAEPYAILGYSMGCITAVNVLKALYREERYPLPGHIFLAAHEPNTVSSLDGLTGEEADSVIKERVLSFGTVPDQLMENPTFWRIYLPLYRVDYRLISQFDFQTLQLKSDIPAVVFYSETDTPFSEMKKWDQYFTGDLDFFRLEGNHFFMQNHVTEMADVIVQRMVR